MLRMWQIVVLGTIFKNFDQILGIKFELSKTISTKLMLFKKCGDQNQRKGYVLI